MIKIISENKATFNNALMVAGMAFPVAYAVPMHGTIDIISKHHISTGTPVYEDTLGSRGNYSRRNAYTEYLMKPVYVTQKNTAMTAPRTGLAKRLLEIRNAAISKGMRLLSEDEISLMIEGLRGDRG